ncbi:MAG: DNA topoisomerase IV subunit B [Mycoplasmataceae bacterium]|nr:DNA topoisomerase IV subunit B [Mycoplasmataceae bacterium]
MSGYHDDDIKVLTGLDPVRKRPGMYIGSVDNVGLHHLIWEIFDNSVDEVIAGNASIIKITLKKDQSIIVEDNGRGIPTGINKSTGLSSIDTVFTVLHAGGKFDENAYKTAGGLHGVGASVVNALSEAVIVQVKRDGKIYESRYVNGGKIAQPSKIVGDTTNRTGTSVWFKPDKTIFKNPTFNPTTIEERIRESAYLYKGLSIIFENQIDDVKKEFKSETGISEYVAFINEDKTKLNKIAYFQGMADTVQVELALQYTNSSSEIIISFANSVKTRNGGLYVTSFKSTLTECINNAARKWGLLKDRDKNLEGEDAREGLTTIISVRVPEKIIQYKNQTKDELSTPEAASAIKKIFGEKFKSWLDENKKEAEKIIDKALTARDARVAAKEAREDVKALKNTGKRTTIKGSKLTPAQSRDYSNNEVFLVEGDSAGGTAKLARDKIHQAILPLRGKFINVEKAKLKDLLANDEFNTIIAAIGTGIGSDFKIENLKYGKIVIMTDADVDGSHIQTLLLTFFYRFMKQLIETGHIYIAMPPLYKFTNKNSKVSQYVWDDTGLEALKAKTTNFEIQRYKGLGEMDAKQLKETTMHASTRQIIKVSIEDAALAERRVTVLMGDNAQIRKEWIDANVDFAFEGD